MSHETLRRLFGDSAESITVGAAPKFDAVQSSRPRRSSTPLLAAAGVFSVAVIVAFATVVGRDDDAMPAGEQPVKILTSSWAPGNDAATALIAGQLELDRENCVVLVGGGSRLAPVWPANWSAAIVESRLVLRNADGKVVAEDGDQLEAGGAYGSGGNFGEATDYTDDPCASAGTELAFVMSSVTKQK